MVSQKTGCNRKRFEASIRSDAKLRELAANPTIRRNLKSNALRADVEKSSPKPETGTLSQVDAEDGRLSKLDNDINAFKTITEHMKKRSLVK